MGTESPNDSAALDISSNSLGLLIPRLTTDEINNIETPAKGLMVFNLDENRLQYNSGTSETPVWSKMKVEATSEDAPNYTAQFRATNANKNYNTNSNLLIFQSLVWNDNPAIFNKKNNGRIEIKEAGRYLITVNVSLKNLASESLSNFVAPEIRLQVNNNLTGSYASTGFTAAYSNHAEISLHLSEVLELDADDKIRVKTFKSAGSGNAKLRSNTSTYISIEKLQ
ncbi:MAG: hypothetical protein BM564_10660 [Bacteroidetes bacterium MedPE-SWsnd-G2]|nr:MAG: hypothetical protein BM564_10660 [Bacteroidetes bacterium MedPE-SWsnd-G2]